MLYEIGGMHILREESLNQETDEYRPTTVCGLIVAKDKAYQFATTVESAREHGNTEMICQSCLIELLSVVLEDEQEEG